MNPNRTICSILVILGVAAQLIAASLQDHGLVLCIGADGHMAIEPAVNGRCCSLPLVDQPSPDGARALRLQSTDPHQDCGACADLAIASAPLLGDLSPVLSEGPSASLLRALPCVAEPGWDVPSSPDPLSTACFQSSSASPATSMLRSVVLLI